ncbi:hypothetical protein, partial [Pseudomonas syringae]|uniref:hypothetical protein n=2 Tax=Pseudomonas syringae group TaxID=136849 RepID=UPI00159BA291
AFAACLLALAGIFEIGKAHLAHGRLGSGGQAYFITSWDLFGDSQGTDKALYKYDNYHCLFALLKNLFWISLAIYLGESAPWLLPLAILLIGSRLRSLVCVSPTN